MIVLERLLENLFDRFAGREYGILRDIPDEPAPVVALPLVEVGAILGRIGEGSGSTNVLTNSGVDEAWATGVQLGESVLELLKARNALNMLLDLDLAIIEDSYKAEQLQESQQRAETSAGDFFTADNPAGGR